MFGGQPDFSSRQGGHPYGLPQPVGQQPQTHVMGPGPPRELGFPPLDHGGPRQMNVPPPGAPLQHGMQQPGVRMNYIPHVPGPHADFQRSVSTGGAPGMPMQPIMGHRSAMEAPRVFNDADFPALGGGGGGMPPAGSGDARGRPSQVASPRLQQRGNEFVVNQEEFPALSAQAPSQQAVHTQGVSLQPSHGFPPQQPPQQHVGLTAQQQQQQQLQQHRLAQKRQQPGQLPLHQSLPPHAQQEQSGAGGPQSSARGGSAAADIPENPEVGKFGLMGLLPIIQMEDTDVSYLALGADLTTLGGLALSAPDVLYPTFGSPWSDTPSRKEPSYVLPYCYYQQPPALKTSHLQRFKLETLMYIFYSMPRDALQLFAAKELYKRHWQYHTELQLWMCDNQSSSDPPPHLVSEKGWRFFDTRIWNQRMLPRNQYGRDGKLDTSKLLLPAHVDEMNVSSA